jgi:uncharacterized membrane protein
MKRSGVKFLQAAWPRLNKVWQDLRSSLWFLPAVSISGAVALALGLIDLGGRIDPQIYEASPRLFGVGAEGARGMLEAIASSMITVVGVTFSITIVALSLASSQYSSRVLRTFLRDQANQMVLAALVGIFAYCIVVLRTIHGGEVHPFVPPLAVLFAVALAFVGIAFLVFFIHHIANSIQASHILAAIGGETRQAVEHLFPEGLGREEEECRHQEYEQRLKSITWHAALAEKTGYIQRVDPMAMLTLASQEDLVIRMELGIGEFVIEGTPLASVSQNDQRSESIARAINAAFIVSRFRTIDQDPGFGVRQIVDMALKGLSPGINDTTTAAMCVDYLTDILVRLTCRHVESPYRLHEGALRVITRGPTFESLLGESFDQIRRNAAGNVTVLSQLARSIGIIGGATSSAGRRMALADQLDEVAEVVRRTIQAPRDRLLLEQQIERLSWLRAAT